MIWFHVMKYASSVVNVSAAHLVKHKVRGGAQKLYFQTQSAGFYLQKHLDHGADHVKAARDHLHFNHSL